MGELNETNPGDEAIPLARLFAMAFRDLIDGLHGRMAQRGWTDLRPAYGFVLLATRDEPQTATAIAQLLGFTKQAASKLLDGMEAAGLVRRLPHGDDARAKLIGLTPRGHRFLADAEEIYAELEREWARITGADRLAALRHDLVAVLRGSHAGELPPVRPTW